MLVAERNRLPDQIMFTVYPQRWTDDPLQWTKELALQNAKNINKRFIAQKGTKAGDRKSEVRCQRTAGRL